MKMQGKKQKTVAGISERCQSGSSSLGGMTIHSPAAIE
jgi:hypothetical protein